MNTIAQTYGIFLDDERSPQDVTWVNYPKDILWNVVRTPEEFKEEVSYWFNFEGTKHNLIISFDHDIQAFEEGKETTGHDLLKWMVDYLIDWEVSVPKCMFHTQNNVGKKNMEIYWENFLTTMR